MKPRDKLAAEIRALSQPPTKTPEQIEFERFLKCNEQRRVSNALANALTRDSRESDPAPLIAPSQLLPPMF